MKRQLMVDYDIVAEGIVCLMRAQTDAENMFYAFGEARWHVEAERLREVVDKFKEALLDSKASWPPKGTF